MDNIIKYLSTLPKAHFSTGVSNALIKEAEKNLSIKFAPEYVTFLQNFGGMMYKGFEFLGITENHICDTIEYTKDARNEDNSIPSNLYVIASAGMDGILYLQGENGTVYRHIPFNTCVPINPSLVEFIKSIH